MCVFLHPEVYNGRFSENPGFGRFSLCHGNDPRESTTIAGRYQTVTLKDDLQNWVRRIYTHNPFYVISAVFVLYGLFISFDRSGETFQTNALVVGLIAYTLLLAGSAWFLIRFGNLWEDVRTLLLLVVLMLLAISICFDETLAASAENPELGIPPIFYCGLAFAIVVTERSARDRPAVACRDSACLFTRSWRPFSSIPWSSSNGSRIRGAPA